MGGPSRALRRFTTRDLVLIAIVAALGIAIKPVVVPLAHLVSAPLLIPGGALAGGLYMMWLVVGMGLVGKPGTATLIALVQALLVMFTGVVGSHGAMSLISYTAPGIVMDLGLLLVGHRACCLRCCFLAGILANVTGTLMVSFIFFRLPPIPLALALCTAALSGGVGGVIAWEIIKQLRRYRIGFTGAGDRMSDERDPGAGGTSTASLMVVVVATAVAFALTGCSGGAGAAQAGGAGAEGGSAASSAPAAETSPGSSAGAAAIAVVDGRTGRNATLKPGVVFASAPAVSGELPLSAALTTAGLRAARRVSLYGADGAVVDAPVASCALHADGALTARGRDMGAVIGIVLDPPAASVRDVCALAEKALESGTRTLIVYLDGFGYDQYFAAKKRGDLPNLSKLRAARAATVYPTITPVTFAAMVSGEDPATTGVHDRGTHRLSCETVFDWAAAQDLSAAVVEGNVQILDLTDDTELTVDEDGDGLTDDEAFAAARRRLLKPPDLLLVHLHGIDDAAHDDGPFGAATIARVTAEDGMVGRLMDRWDGRVIVVADHGLHTIDDPGEGEGRGAHGEFRAEDLFVPLLVGTTH